MKIYLDESGELGFSDRSSKYFVIVLVVCDDEKSLKRLIKKIRGKKLKKTIKNLPEIKANNSTNEIRNAVLKDISKINLSIYSHIQNKSNIVEGSMDTKEFYNNVALKVISRIAIKNKIFEIIVDKSKSKKERAVFNSMVTDEINKVKSFIEIKITHLDSKNSPALQAVDFISWAIFRKYEKKDTTFYDIIKGRIVSEINE
ncbi:MAG: DUF3800 domain-containing protein [Methanofastidiosum sp.]